MVRIDITGVMDSASLALIAEARVSPGMLGLWEPGFYERSYTYGKEKTKLSPEVLN